VMGPGQNFLSRVRSGQFIGVRVGSGQPSLVGNGNFPLKIPNFSGQKKLPWVGSKSTRVKDGSASNLQWVKRMLRVGLDQSPFLGRRLKIKMKIKTEVLQDTIIELKPKANMGGVLPCHPSPGG